MATFHENLVQSFHNFRDKYLKANGNFFKFSYDATTQKYGFTINGTFHPFKSVQASKTVTAGTAAKTVTPDSGYDGVASVTVNPTPSQTKSATAGTSAITVSPDSGKLLSKVTVSPTPSQTKSASPSTSAQTVSPDSGKLLSSVSISAISPQRVPTTPNQATLTGYNTTGAYVWFPEGWWPAQDNTHGSYVYMTQAQAQQAHAHTGTRATVTSNGTIDLGATHNIRYVPVNVSGSGLVPISVAVSHSENSTANSITLRYFDVASKSFKTSSTTVYGSTSQFGRGSWSVSLAGITCSISISEISVGSGSMVRLSVSTGATSIAKALSGYADYNVPNSSYAYSMTALLS